MRSVSSRVTSYVDAIAGAADHHEIPFFICTRSDFISGDPARLLGIPATQAFFVDRAVVPHIVHSALTVRGEDLLPLVPMPAIRRLDVFKAFFGLANQLLLTAAAFPFVPSATQYATGALKRSVHNCYFCYHLRTAALEEEIDFFRRDRKYPTLDQLLELRREPRHSLRFVLRCIPTAALLHLRTARENDFPKHVRGAPAAD